jgi:NB-ARC domain
MAIELNLNGDRDLAVAGGDGNAQVEALSIYDAITGQIAVGRYLLEIGDPCGALIREVSRTGRAPIRPRPTPVLVRPRLIRGLIDRRMELAAALSALDTGLPIEANGDPGIGKTAVLRHLAHHPRAASFADGIVYVSARHQPSADLLQLIFEAFYEIDAIFKPTDAEIRRGLQDKQALILLDDVHLAQHELEQVLDMAPRSAFVVAARERCLWGEARNLALKGLPVEDAVSLFEREIERSLDVAERLAAASLCAAVGGHPFRVKQAAAIIREQATPLRESARTIAPDTLITELIASIDEKQRRALLALTALPGVPLQVQHVSGIAEVTDLEPSLVTLVRRGLVVSSQSRYQLADGVSDRLRRSEDLKPWLNRAITYFTAWVERNRRSPNKLIQESEALLCVQQHAADTRRWGEVLRLGRLVEGALVLGARWGAWAITLERSIAAAKAIGDPSTEAWALHQLGTRALCLGEPDIARAWLSQAVALREALNDTSAAAASRRHLSFVLAPVFDHSRTRSRMPIRMAKTRSIGALSLTALLCATVGWLAVATMQGALPWGSWNGASVAPFQSDPGGASRASQPEPARAVQLDPEVIPATAEPILTSQAPREPIMDTANILIFTARPGSIMTAASTELCYAVDRALQVRIEPGIGEVDATSTLACVRVAPVRTTTYELTAFGRDGVQVRQQLVIVVR